MAKRDKLNPTNAEIISSQDVSDSIQYRDVQNRQQLQHSRIEEKKPLWPWRALAIVLGVLSCVLMYAFTSLGATVWGSFTTSSNDAQYVADHEKTLMATTSPATPDMIPGCYGADSGSVLNLPIYVRQVNSYMVANQHYEDRRTNPQCSAYMPADQASGFAVLGNVAYATPQDVPQPEWFQAQLAQAKQQDQIALAKRKSLPKDAWLYSEHSVSENVKHDLKPGLWNTMAGILVGLAVYSMAFVKFKRNWVSQNIQYDTADINQHEDDQHLMINEELFDHFDIFPDIGAHSSVVPRALISHVFLTNKGLNKIRATRFYDKDTEIDGEKYFKGEPMFAEDSDEPLSHMVPMIDEAHGDSLMDASAVPQDKRIRRRFDPAKTVYRQAGGGCGKLKGYTNWAEVINNDWTFPDYEPSRPAGVYLVDTDPVNTMVLAITRAGKGQTIIEPTLDMWTRCNEKSNIVVNDPKGELLIKCYVKATVRGFQPVQFNLIEPVKTDIYNPLLMAADAAREGDSTRCAQYVESIGNVFFPADSGEDPVWPNAANNAFQRAAYGMIDYYYEAEKSLRARAERDHISPKTLETMVDQLWGKVTLYNCYQLFVQLTSKKLKNPAVELSKDVQANEDKYKQMSQADYDKLVADTEAKAVLWDNAAEIDELTLFFNATAALPRNSVRTLVGNADNALRAMGAAEKMLASVYGIAITAMSFFANPTISTLTSGTPSQNVDLAGLSFPRRFGVRFDSDFLATHHLATMQCRWTGYDDPNFETPLGKDFTHTDMVTREGWARCFFKGIWPHDTGYLKLEILDPSSGRLIRTMFFQFEKRYLTTLDGAFYLKDPILDERVPNGGIIIELKQTAHGFKPGRDTFVSKTIGNLDQPVDKMTVETIDKPIISQTSVHYGEKPKMIFLVTPPHLTAYAKLILILLKQLVDLNFEQSYTTKESQKPLYATQFMLDELGNLQSDGHGIDSFGTMLSIGLGQSQFFTIILQTLQQLRDVYGQDVDKVIQGNTANIVFLKSTDDQMIDTLSKMSGKTHRVVTNSKTITTDESQVMMRTDAKVSKTMTSEEVPVISYNDMAYIPKCNSMVFRAGTSAIWNRNETVLPMSWNLYKDTIINPGHEYSLKTIPSLSTAKDFDVKRNQPDFDAMLERRVAQAIAAPKATEAYQTLFGLSDADMARNVGDDNFADAIMRLVDSLVDGIDAAQDNNDPDMVQSPDAAGGMDNWDPDDDYDDGAGLNADGSLKTSKAQGKSAAQNTASKLLEGAQENTEVEKQTQMTQAQAQDWERPRYCGGRLSRADLCSIAGAPTHQLDEVLSAAIEDAKAPMQRDKHNFRYDAALGTFYVRDEQGRMDALALRMMGAMSAEQRASIQAAAKDPASRTFGEPDDMPYAQWQISDVFYRWLVSLDSWSGIAEGKFEQFLIRALDLQEQQSGT